MTTETLPQTPKGTPLAKSWDDAWIAVVSEAETRLDRRICGARTMSGGPCLMHADHENGRCKHHGGFDLTGAPKGNRNAVLHDLYSRRLQVCGSHCPLWNACPCASQAVLELDPKDRPACPFEQAEYDAVVADALASLEASGNTDPQAEHLAHTKALLQVMLSRAATALGRHPLVEEADTSVGSDRSDGLDRGNTEDNTAKRRSSKARISPYLTAFLRISSEYRQIYKLTVGTTAKPKASQPKPVEETTPDPEQRARDDERANLLIDRATAAAGRLNETQALRFFNEAIAINPQLADASRDKIAAGFREGGGESRKAKFVDALNNACKAQTRRDLRLSA